MSAPLQAQVNTNSNRRGSYAARKIRTQGDKITSFLESRDGPDRRRFSNDPNDSNSYHIDPPDVVQKSRRIRRAQGSGGGAGTWIDSDGTIHAGMNKGLDERWAEKYQKHANIYDENTIVKEIKTAAHVVPKLIGQDIFRNALGITDEDILHSREVMADRRDQELRALAKKGSAATEGDVITLASTLKRQEEFAQDYKALDEVNANRKEQQRQEKMNEKYQMEEDLRTRTYTKAVEAQEHKILDDVHEKLENLIRHDAMDQIDRAEAHHIQSTREDLRFNKSLLAMIQDYSPKHTQPIPDHHIGPVLKMAVNRYRENRNRGEFMDQIKKGFKNTISYIQKDRKKKETNRAHLQRVLDIYDEKPLLHPIALMLNSIVNDNLKLVNKKKRKLLTSSRRFQSTSSQLLAEQRGGRSRASSRGSSLSTVGPRYLQHLLQNLQYSLYNQPLILAQSLWQLAPKIPTIIPSALHSDVFLVSTNQQVVTFVPRPVDSFLYDLIMANTRENQSEFDRAREAILNQIQDTTSGPFQQLVSTTGRALSRFIENLSPAVHNVLDDNRGEKKEDQSQQQQQQNLTNRTIAATKQFYQDLAQNPYWSKFFEFTSQVGMFISNEGRWGEQQQKVSFPLQSQRIAQYENGSMNNINVDLTRVPFDPNHQAQTTLRTFHQTNLPPPLVDIPHHLQDPTKTGLDPYTMVSFPLDEDIHAIPLTQPSPHTSPLSDDKPSVKTNPLINPNHHYSSQFLAPTMFTNQLHPITIEQHHNEFLSRQALRHNDNYEEYNRIQVKLQHDRELLKDDPDNIQLKHSIENTKLPSFDSLYPHDDYDKDPVYQTKMNHRRMLFDQNDDKGLNGLPLLEHDPISTVLSTKQPYTLPLNELTLGLYRDHLTPISSDETLIGDISPYLLQSPSQNHTQTHNNTDNHFNSMTLRPREQRFGDVLQHVQSQHPWELQSNAQRYVTFLPILTPPIGDLTQTGAQKFQHNEDLYTTTNRPVHAVLRIFHGDKNFFNPTQLSQHIGPLTPFQQHMEREHGVPYSKNTQEYLSQRRSQQQQQQQLNSISSRLRESHHVLSTALAASLYSTPPSVQIFGNFFSNIYLPFYHRALVNDNGQDRFTEKMTPQTQYQNIAEFQYKQREKKRVALYAERHQLHFKRFYNSLAMGQLDLFKNEFSNAAKSHLKVNNPALLPLDPYLAIKNNLWHQFLYNQVANPIDATVQTYNFFQSFDFSPFLTNHLTSASPNEIIQNILSTTAAQNYYQRQKIQYRNQSYERNNNAQQKEQTLLVKPPQYWVERDRNGSFYPHNPINSSIQHDSSQNRLVEYDTSHVMNNNNDPNHKLSRQESNNAMARQAHHYTIHALGYQDLNYNLFVNQRDGISTQQLAQRTNQPQNRGLYRAEKSIVEKINSLPFIDIVGKKSLSLTQSFSRQPTLVSTSTQSQLFTYQQPSMGFVAQRNEDQSKSQQQSRMGIDVDRKVMFQLSTNDYFGINTITKRPNRKSKSNLADLTGNIVKMIQNNTESGRSISPTRPSLIHFNHNLAPISQKAILATQKSYLRDQVQQHLPKELFNTIKNNINELHLFHHILLHTHSSSHQLPSPFIPMRSSLQFSPTNQRFISPNNTLSIKHGYYQNRVDSFHHFNQVTISGQVMTPVSRREQLQHFNQIDPSNHEFRLITAHKHNGDPATMVNRHLTQTTLLLQKHQLLLSSFDGEETGFVRDKKLVNQNDNPISSISQTPSLHTRKIHSLKHGVTLSELYFNNIYQYNDSNNTRTLARNLSQFQLDYQVFLSLPQSPILTTAFITPHQTMSNNNNQNPVLDASRYQFMTAMSQLYDYIGPNLSQQQHHPSLVNVQKALIQNSDLTDMLYQGFRGRHLDGVQNDAYSSAVGMSKLINEKMNVMKEQQIDTQKFNSTAQLFMNLSNIVNAITTSTHYDTFNHQYHHSSSQQKREEAINQKEQRMFSNNALRYRLDPTLLHNAGFTGLPDLPFYSIDYYIGAGYHGFQMNTNMDHVEQQGKINFVRDLAHNHDQLLNNNNTADPIEKQSHDHNMSMFRYNTHNNTSSLTHFPMELYNPSAIVNNNVRNNNNNPMFTEVTSTSIQKVKESSQVVVSREKQQIYQAAQKDLNLTHFRQNLIIPSEIYSDVPVLQSMYLGENPVVDVNKGNNNTKQSNQTQTLLNWANNHQNQTYQNLFTPLNNTEAQQQQQGQQLNNQQIHPIYQITQFSEENKIKYESIRHNVNVLLDKRGLHEENSDEIYIGGLETEQGLYGALNTRSHIIGILSSDDGMGRNNIGNNNNGNVNTNTGQRWLLYDPLGLDRDELLHALHQQFELDQGIDNNNNPENTTVKNGVGNYLQFYDVSRLSTKAVLLNETILNNEHPQPIAPKVGQNNYNNINLASPELKRTKFTISSFLSSKYPRADILTINRTKDGQLPHFLRSFGTDTNVNQSKTNPLANPATFLTREGQPKYQVINISQHNNSNDIAPSLQPLLEEMIPMMYESPIFNNHNNNNTQQTSINTHSSSQQSPLHHLGLQMDTQYRPFHILNQLITPMINSLDDTSQSNNLNGNINQYINQQEYNNRQYDQDIIHHNHPSQTSLSRLLYNPNQALAGDNYNPNSMDQNPNRNPLGSSSSLMNKQKQHSNQQLQQIQEFNHRQFYDNSLTQDLIYREHARTGLPINVLVDSIHNKIGQVKEWLNPTLSGPQSFKSPSWALSSYALRLLGATNKALDDQEGPMRVEKYNNAKTVARKENQREKNLSGFRPDLLPSLSSQQRPLLHPGAVLNNTFLLQSAIHEMLPRHLFNTENNNNNNNNNNGRNNNGGLRAPKVAQERRAKYQKLTNFVSQLFTAIHYNANVAPENQNPLARHPYHDQLPYINGQGNKYSFFPSSSLSPAAALAAKYQSGQVYNTKAMNLITDVLKDIASTHLATRYVQKFGLDAHPLAVFNFLKPYSQRATRLQDKFKQESGAMVAMDYGRGIGQGSSNGVYMKTAPVLRPRPQFSATNTSQSPQQQSAANMNRGRVNNKPQQTQQQPQQQPQRRVKFASVLDSGGEIELFHSHRKDDEQ